MYDTIIIGAGPAGVSAAIYLKRFNYNPLIIYKDFGTLGKTTYIDNYYGIEHIKGSELAEKGLNQAKSLGIDIVNDEVTSIEYDALGFKVITKESSFVATTVFLATGKARNKLLVKGIKEFEGKGISYCAICDGFFYRGKKLGLIGNGAFAEGEYETLKKFTSDITLFTNGLDTTIKADKIVSEKIVSIYGSELVSGIETENNKYDLDGIFIAYGTANAQSFAKHLGLQLDSQDNIVTKDYMTNIPGIFAGGDVIGGLLQVSKAVSDGANASLEIKKYLMSKKSHN